MTLWGPIIIAVIAGETIAILWGAVRLGWAPFHEPFPAKPHADGAVTRRFQTFKVSFVNLGWSVHASVDEKHLHLMPVRLLRSFGARPVSIPWDAIHIEKRSRSGRWVTVKIGGRTVFGPAWCLDLAEPPSPDHA